MRDEDQILLEKIYLESSPMNKTGPVYHGTNDKFEKFQLHRKSINTTTFGDVETTRAGIFFTDNIKFAKTFGKHITKAMLNIKNPVTMNQSLIHGFTETIDPFDERDLWLQARYTKEHWGFFEGELGIRFVEYLKFLGYDAVWFKEETTISDDEEGRTIEYIEGKTIVVFDPGVVEILSG